MTRLAQLSPNAGPAVAEAPDYLEPLAVSQGDLVDFADDAMCICGRTLVDHEVHEHAWDPAPGELADANALGWSPC